MVITIVVAFIFIMGMVVMNIKRRTDFRTMTRNSRLQNLQFEVPQDNLYPPQQPY